ncbi:MAG: TonB-dependent receptor plug domain-containing protein, partial [Bacteroidales bacterium]|nr:TonB-dependent receptor plug domain-containing protein [Bacteroidales bacterium]
MQRKLCLILLVFSFSLKALPQSIEDSVYILKSVEISAGQIFKKEDAGMKRTTVDTLILLQKINLSLSELLSQNTPGFIKDYGRGGLATASFRGTAASHTKVNWNGMSINSPMAGMVDFSLIPVYIIDDINLQFGAASIAGNSGGLGGSINIGNTVDWKNKTGIKFMQGIGSYNTFDEFLQLALGNSSFQSKTRFYHNYSKNDYPYINRGIGEIDPGTGEIINPAETNANAGFTRYGLLQELYFKPNNKNIFSTKWWFQNAGRTVPRATSYEGPDNANLNKQVDSDNKIVTDWKHFGEKYMLAVRSGYSAKQLDYSLKNNVPGLGPVPAIYSESSQNSFLNTVSLDYDFTSSFSVETALDLNYHDVVSRDTVQKNGYEKNRSEVSWFIALRKNVSNRLNLNLMLRQDWVDSKAVPAVPFFGFDFRIIKGEELFLKGNFARNFHQPDLNALYWQPGGNPDLLPEKGISIELGLEYETRWKKTDFKTEITAFRSDIDNWIIWLPSYKGYWEPANIRRVLSQGIELNASLGGDAGKIHYKVSANYAYTSSVNYGDPLVWGDESYGK